MLIDIVFAILMVLAIFKGMSRGFIVAVFSLFAFLIGLAAALKLSATVANYLHTKASLSGHWLPFLSFLLVFVAVVFIVRWAASLVKKAVSLVFLGWVDSIAGVLLYAVMYLMIYSVILFFATRIGIISAAVKATSKTYFFIEPFGPRAMSLLGMIIPFFSHVFADLSQFFQGVAQKAT